MRRPVPDMNSDNWSVYCWRKVESRTVSKLTDPTAGTGQNPLLRSKFPHLFVFSFYFLRENDLSDCLTDSSITQEEIEKAIHT